MSSSILYLAHVSSCFICVKTTRLVSYSSLFVADVSCYLLKITVNILLFVFKVLNGMAPPYLSELVTVNISARCLRSSNENLLKVPRSETGGGGFKDKFGYYI